MTYIVSFNAETDATRLAVCNLLKTYSGYCPIHRWCWAVSTTETAAQIRDKVSAVLTNGGNVFVIRSGVEAAWANTYGEANSKWLKENL